MVSLLHHRNTRQNLFTLLWDPMEDLEQPYNLTEYLFYQNFNYYLGSKIQVRLKQSITDPQAQNFILDLLLTQKSNMSQVAEKFLNPEDVVSHQD